MPRCDAGIVLAWVLTCTCLGRGLPCLRSQYNVTLSDGTLAPYMLHFVTSNWTTASLRGAKAVDPNRFGWDVSDRRNLADGIFDHWMYNSLVFSVPSLAPYKAKLRAMAAPFLERVIADDQGEGGTCALWAGWPGSSYALQLVSEDGCDKTATPKFDTCAREKHLHEAKPSLAIDAAGEPRPFNVPHHPKRVAHSGIAESRLEAATRLEAQPDDLAARSAHDARRAGAPTKKDNGVTKYAERMGAAYAAQPVVGLGPSYAYEFPTKAKLPVTMCAPLAASVDRHTVWFKGGAEEDHSKNPVAPMTNLRTAAAVLNGNTPASDQQSAERKFVQQIGDSLCANKEQSADKYNTMCVCGLESTTIYRHSGAGTYAPHGPHFSTAH